VEGLFEEVVQLTVIGGRGRQNIDLIFSLYDDFEGSYHVNGLTVDLDRDDLVIDFALKSDGSPLTHNKGLIHADLHLSHV
jgi:hypothetical protein